MIGPVMKVAGRSKRVMKLSRAGYAVEGTGDVVAVGAYVSRPMASQAVRRDLIGGAAAAAVYDIATSQSPGSRSERNGPNVGPGGITLRDMVEPNFNKARNVTHGNRRSMFCPEGYQLRKVNKKWMCVRIRK